MRPVRAQELKLRLSWPLVFAAALAAWVWSEGMAAAAAPPPTPAVTTRVLGLHVEGPKLSAKDRADLFQVLQAKLRHYPGFELKNPPEAELTDEMIDLECVDLDAECLTKLGKKYGADKVVYVEAEPQGAGQHQLRVRVLDVTTGKATRDSTAKVATAAALAPAMEAEVEAAFGKPPEVVKAVANATITIEADQPGALIYLGSEVVGTGRVTLEKPPGAYTFRIAAMGFEEQIVGVTAGEGEAVAKKVTLVKMAIDKPPKKDDDDGPSWVVWAVIGAVVVGGAVTAIALASDSGDDTVRGRAVLSIDGSAAWRDPATLGGRP